MRRCSDQHVCIRIHPNVDRTNRGERGSSWGFPQNSYFQPPVGRLRLHIGAKSAFNVQTSTRHINTCATCADSHHRPASRGLRSNESDCLAQRGSGDCSTAGRWRRSMPSRQKPSGSQRQLPQMSGRSSACTEARMRSSTSCHRTRLPTWKPSV